MSRLVALFLMLFPALAVAGPVAVQTGDHDGFTRVVLSFDQGADWALAPVDAGYEFRLSGPKAHYDLSGAFRLIQRNRIADMTVNAATGHLLLRLACSCPATPAEFRRGLVVIDIADAPPEVMHRAKDVPVLPLFVPMPPAVAFTPPPDLAPFRANLLAEMSAAATRGTVTLKLPPAQGIPAAPPDAPAHLRIGEDIGMVSRPPGQPAAALTESGAACLPDDALMMENWGGEGDVGSELAVQRAGLVGEFDRPDLENLVRAVRFYLYLGFGAEAKNLLSRFDIPNSAALLALSAIMDQGETSALAFNGMVGCDGRAALWAALSEKNLAPGANAAAILRAFSALPVHLRQHLGPGLVDRFLAQDDTRTAEAIRSMTLRAPGDPGPEVRLMTADVDLALGQTASAEKTLDALRAENSGAALDALLKWVDLQVAAATPVDKNTVVLLDAMAFEFKGTSAAPRLARGRILALALQGGFEAAFESLPDAPESAATLWDLLAKTGDDDAVLTHAVLQAGSQPPNISFETRGTLARRLSDLGLPEVALLWLPETQGNIAGLPETERVLIAGIELRARNALAAKRWVAGLATPEATRIAAEAELQLGNPAAAAPLFDAIDDTEKQHISTQISQDWANLAAGPAGDIWVAAARRGNATPPTEAGVLATGRALVAESAETRHDLTNLLAETTPAAVPKP